LSQQRSSPRSTEIVVPSESAAGEDVDGSRAGRARLVVQHAADADPASEVLGNGVRADAWSSGLLSQSATQGRGVRHAAAHSGAAASRAGQSVRDRRQGSSARDRI